LKEQGIDPEKIKSVPPKSPPCQNQAPESGAVQLVRLVQRPIHDLELVNLAKDLAVPGGLAASTTSISTIEDALFA
jgi:hypothetical protein